MLQNSRESSAILNYTQSNLSQTAQLSGSLTADRTMKLTCLCLDIVLNPEQVEEFGLNLPPATFENLLFFLLKRPDLKHANVTVYYQVKLFC